MSQKKRKSCPIRHVNFYIVTQEDGTHKIKCVNSKTCGDECPYLKDPKYQFEYNRAPQFTAK